MATKQVQIILKQDVENVGIKGQIHRVSRGFAKNFLLPRGAATLGTKASLAAALKEQEALKELETQEAQKSLVIKQKLEEKPLSFSVKASKDEILYGSITKQDVADELMKVVGITVDKKNIFLPQSIKKAGEYPVTIKLLKNIKAKTRLVITAEIGSEE